MYGPSPPKIGFDLVPMNLPITVNTDDPTVCATTLTDEYALVMERFGFSLAEIDTWREPDRLLELAEWAVGPRPGAPVPDRGALRERFGAAESRIHILEAPSLDVSSTEIRRRVAAGRSIRYLVPRAVSELIADRGLYRRA